MSRKIINYVEMWQGGCGLTTDNKTEVLRREGTSNVRSVRPATRAEVDWVRTMGGCVPDGRVLKQGTQP